MAKKPTYLGMLNAIANGERGGHELFKTWGSATKNKALKATLSTLALRELEHSVAFEKRIHELGYELRPPSDVAASKVLAKQIKLLDSKAGDLKKFAAFGFGTKRPDASAKKRQKKRETDSLLGALADTSIDAQTGALIGRFICEERDTGRMLHKAYKKLRKQSKRK